MLHMSEKKCTFVAKLGEYAIKTLEKEQKTKVKTNKDNERNRKNRRVLFADGTRVSCA